MSAVIGSDPDQLDQLAATMLACADRLDGVRSELAFALAGSPWQGGDAEDFRWDWAHQLAGLVQGASAGVREASGRVRANAAQQRQVSADDGARAGAPFADRAGGGGWAGENGFDPLGMATAFGSAAMNLLGYAAGAVGLVKDGHDGLLGRWAKSRADQVIGLADGVRVGGAVPLRIAGELLDKIALPLGVVDTWMAGAEFAEEAEKDVNSRESFDAAVDTALGVAGVAAGVTALAVAGTAAAPVVAGVSAGLFVGGLVWEGVSATTGVDEWVHEEFWDEGGVGVAVKAVGDGVGDIIEGGLNALLGR